MQREIEVHFGGVAPYFTVHPIEVTCGTELMVMAESLRREAGADFVTFGPAFERYEDGTPAYGRKK